MNSVLNRLINRYYSKTRLRSIVRAHKLHRDKYTDEYTIIDDMISKFRQSGGLKHDYQAYKLYCLHKLLEEYKPHRIIEFGSGSSTLSFSKYVRENGASLFSIDEDEKWASNTRKLVGIEPGEQIQIMSSPKTFINSTNPPEVKYDVDITGDFDFVFIDGPSLKIDGVKHKHAINSNVFDLKSLPEVIVVDVRKATAQYITSKYSELYTAYSSDLFSGKTVDKNYNYFTFFVKKK